MRKVLQVAVALEVHIMCVYVFDAESAYRSYRFYRWFAITIRKASHNA